jgi:cardiolipin synthase
MKKPAESIWNVPNILTILRIALVPVYIIFYRKGDYYGALAVFLVASLTDFLDGKIARKHHLVTSYGKLMDPLADKLMCITVLLSFTFSGTIQWTPAAFVIAKELLMLIGGTYLLKRGIVVQSKLIGKTAQLLFVIALCMGFFHDFFASWILPLDVMLLWTALIMAFLALIFYAFDASKAAKAMSKRSIQDINNEHPITF